MSFWAASNRLTQVVPTQCSPVTLGHSLPKGRPPSKLDPRSQLSSLSAPRLSPLLISRKLRSVNSIFVVPLESIHAPSPLLLAYFKGLLGPTQTPLEGLSSRPPQRLEDALVLLHTKAAGQAADLEWEFFAGPGLRSYFGFDWLLLPYPYWLSQRRDLVARVEEF